jgi:hypothetical protein
VATAVEQMLSWHRTPWRKTTHLFFAMQLQPRTEGSCRVALKHEEHPDQHGTSRTMHLSAAAVAITTSMSVFAYLCQLQQVCMGYTNTCQECDKEGYNPSHREHQWLKRQQVHSCLAAAQACITEPRIVTIALICSRLASIRMFPVERDHARQTSHPFRARTLLKVIHGHGHRRIY